MPRVNIVKVSKTGQIKYSMILPKSLMEQLAVKKGDKFELVAIAGEQITFRLERL